MNVNEYTEYVVNDFIKNITDNLFLYIEQNDDIMRDYMTNVNRYGLDTLNMAIGLKIKEKLSLENEPPRGKPRGIEDLSLMAVE